MGTKQQLLKKDGMCQALGRTYLTVHIGRQQCFCTKSTT